MNSEAKTKWKSEFGATQWNELAEKSIIIFVKRFRIVGGMVNKGFFMNLERFIILVKYVIYK